MAAGKSDISKGAAALKNAMGDAAHVYDAHKHGESLKGEFFNKDGRVFRDIGFESEEAHKEALER
jgi:hypothetical protein